MKNPDYIGNCKLFRGHEFIYLGDFKFYIFKKKNLEEKIDYISGIIIDNVFGEAEFEGEISPDYISFIKKYNKKAILKGAHDGIIKFNAMRTKNLLREYTGAYMFIDQDSNICYCDWHTKFTMRLNINPMNN